MSDRRLYLIRHARPDYTSSLHSQTPLGLQYDPPLGEVGREQAARLADRLELLDRPAAVYSSTLARARETAHVYADRIDMPVIERDDLCEWFAGEWEAKDFEQIFQEHPDAIDLFRNQNPAWHLAPGSERADAFQQRCVEAVESIIDAHPEGDVVVVAHGGVINGYFSHILGIRDQDMFFLPENTSLNTVVIRGDERRAWFLSDASHLTDPGWFELREWERDVAEGS
ncbi:MAG: histidine phosphatase family protein [Actinomycetota bacterium]|nr:histidine phosphatase family protein [Actinomycetota bacterium]MDH5224302.1 histidine phosphatase family protein [Actinomycetota bacterium]MDH5314622.1 histidine phosphatase family protein [Actinomycetota bacterium]